jgi:hypothetical protein
MTWIVLDLNEEIVTGAEKPYRVIYTVSDASGIDRELFVYFAEDGRYSNVAVSEDLWQYPTSRDEARRTDKQFFRTNKLTVDFAHRDIAREFETFTRGRLDFVTRDWSDQSSIDFGGNTTEVLSTES